jgi:hypothetical protein
MRTWGDADRERGNRLNCRRHHERKSIRLLQDHNLLAEATLEGWKSQIVKSAKGSIHRGRHSELVAQQNRPWRKVGMCASSNKTARAYRAGTKEPGRDLVSSKEMVIGVRAKRIAGMQEWESPCLCVQACFGELVSFR